MKNDTVMYKKVYRTMKNKILCGVMPECSQLPSRAKLCEEYHTSEKTIRKALAMLEKDGLIKCIQRKRPIIVHPNEWLHQTSQLALKQADSIIADDVLKSSILLCYSLVRHGIMLCTDQDWVFLNTLLDHMDPQQDSEFWQLSNQFWRYFVARNGNELILRVVDGLGFAELETLQSDSRMREAYLKRLRDFLNALKSGDDPASVTFADMSVIYTNKSPLPAYRAKADSVFCTGIHDLEKRLRSSEERYSSVCIDLLGRIAVGIYQPYDYLPSHKELQKIYGVSIDTTLKAVKMLHELGAVSTSPHKGIKVLMGLEDLQRVHIDPLLIACPIRRFLDSLELLALTAESVAASAAVNVTSQEAAQLRLQIIEQWEKPFEHRFLAGLMLRFIISHIQYQTLHTVYEIIHKNFNVGKRMPAFISKEKSSVEYDIYMLCLNAAQALEKKENTVFAEQTAKIFQMIYLQVTKECRALGYWEVAMQVYDRSSLYQ